MSSELFQMFSLLPDIFMTQQQTSGIIFLIGNITSSGRVQIIAIKTMQNNILNMDYV